MKGDIYNVAEFYKSGESRPFCRRSGMANIPTEGDQVDIAGIQGKVVTVTWNLDYCGRPDEQWRANIFLMPRDT